MSRVLIIEDEIPLRQEIVDILQFEGFEVLAAGDGLEGLSLAQDNPPDLIVSDILMPQLDGYGLLQRLRSCSETAITPLIFLTAKAEKSDMRRGMELGADDYLCKPFTREDLLNAVRSRLEKHALIMTSAEKPLSELRHVIANSLPHELRTPLISVIASGELLQWQAETLQPGDIARFGRSIAAGGNRLLHLIENYLSYTRVEALARDAEQLAQIRQAQTAFPGYVIHSAALGIASHHQREGDVRVEAAHAVLAISEDSLTKIIRELCDNAFRFSEAGQPVVVIGAVTADGYVISVSDRGRGMTPEQIRKIGAFTQFDRALYEQQGSGLGLELSRKLTELFGGSLAVASTAGEGTTVTVRVALG
ncbi:MAG: response regulator [Anaerolinea sp.]|nr:response regulator [Anaerolinea sp.]